MKRSDSFAMYLILALPIIALIAFGWRFGGLRLAIAFGLIALISEVALFYKSDKKLLERFGAREITDSKLAIVQATEQTARIAGVTTPKLYLSRSEEHTSELQSH